MSRKIAVIGAGVGGLSVAARLASRGYSVEVFEKLSECGGRNHMLYDSGFKFDMGPSFVLMPDFFEELFQYCGRDLKRYLNFKMLDVNYKIFYPGEGPITFYSNNDETKQELEKVEAGASAAYDSFIAETARIYHTVKPLLFKCFTRKDILNPAYWPLLFSIRPFESYWSLASRFFKSKKLRYAFTFEAMFMGVSPFNAPAFYSIISYADQVQKIYHPLGGMYEIPLAIENIAKESGAKFHYGTEVNKINRNNGMFNLQINGGSLTFNKVIINADYAYSQEQLLGRNLTDYQYSCSTFLMYLGLKKKITGLQHHNLFFAENLMKNLKQIFNRTEISEDPSFYVHVPTVTDPSLAPQGKDILYILIPVPNNKRFKEEMGEKENIIRSAVFSKINNAIGENLNNLIEVEHKFYPRDFVKHYNIKYGATFGLAHNLMQSAFFRPPNVDGQNKNLYFVGASTQPGGGLPVVIAGSRVVADLINA